MSDKYLTPAEVVQALMDGKKVLYKCENKFNPFDECDNKFSSFDEKRKAWNEIDSLKKRIEELEQGINKIKANTIREALNYVPSGEQAYCGDDVIGFALQYADKIEKGEL